MNNNKGSSLVEVIIAVAILAVTFGIFATVMASAYRTHLVIAERKETRTEANANLEGTVGKNAASSAVGTLKVTLDIPKPKADDSVPDPTAPTYTAECKISRGTYADYKESTQKARTTKYIYAFTE